MQETKQAKQIKNHYEILKNDRRIIDKIRQEIAEYVLPLRENFDPEVPDSVVNGLVKAKKIYDGTAMSALNIAADGFHGYMISPAMRWFTPKLPSRLKFLEKISEVRLWLQDYTDALYTELSNSNFYQEMRMFLRDGLSVSPGAIYIDEDIANDRLVFHAMHPNEIYITEDNHGCVDTVFRHVWLTARQAVERFGLDVLSHQIKQSYENNPFKKFEFIHAVYPREEYDARKVDAINMPYKSCWLEKFGKQIVRESGFGMFPFLIWRYMHNNRNPYGCTPATYAIPEIKRLNIISKSVAGAAQLTTEPPYNVPVEMKGKEKIVPNGINYYGSDFNRRIYPLNTGINYPLSINHEDNIRQSIREHYHVDFFNMLSQLQRQITATEALEIAGEKALIIGAAVSSLTMVLDHGIDYVAYLGTRAGRIPLPPDVVMMYAGGQRIDIEYNGLLAQIQRRIFETMGITRGLTVAAPLIETFPEAGDVINADASVRKILISNGYPEDALATDEQIQQKRQARAQAQMAELQKQEQESMSDVLKKLSQAAKNAGVDFNALMQNAGIANQAQDMMQ